MTRSPDPAAYVLVVYESLFGNTRTVAQAVAEGLRSAAGSAGREVELRDLADVATYPPLRRPDLIVAGGPTHAFSMTRISTRVDAERQGAVVRDRLAGLREWLTHLVPARPGQRMATFDTRAESVRHLPGSAAKAAAKLARKRGYEVVSRESFYVSETRGPLLEGELKRAREWGETLSAWVATSAHRRSGSSGA